MNKKKECLIYLRTSTLTNKEGDSSTRQRSSIMKWVKSNGYIVKGEYWDIESGSTDTMDRPEFVNLVKPPTIIIKKTNNKDIANQNLNKVFIFASFDNIYILYIYYIILKF